MPNIYKFDFLPGLKQFVVEELTEKFGKENIEIIRFSQENIIVRANVNFIEDFRTIKSAKTVSKGNRTIALDKPLWRRYFVHAGLNPSLAWCMCKYGQVNNESLVLDPFCGSGIIGLIAAAEFRAISVHLSDKSGSAIDVAKKNLSLLKVLKSNKKEFLTHDINIFQSAISKLNFGKNKFSHIITNPPYGLRTGSHKNNIEIYRNLRELTEKYLSEHGCLVLVSQEKKLTESIFSYFKMKGKFDVESGGLKLRVWKYALL